MSNQTTTIAEYYDAKTARLLARYGPGPDVHYHTGIVGEADVAAATHGSPRDLRRSMVAGQRGLVDVLRGSLGATLSGHVLDAGCGLGGPAIQLLRSGQVEQVTGVTLSQDHPPIARTLAEHAGVGDRFVAKTADVHALSASALAEGGSPVDAALCLESSCYFNRPRFFAAMKECVHARGYVHVVDCFLADASVKPDFDGYWKTDIASVEHYVLAAKQHGWVLAGSESFNARCFRFWELTLHALALEAQTHSSPKEDTRLSRSKQAHQALLEQFRSGAIDYRCLSFRRGG